MPRSKLLRRLSDLTPVDLLLAGYVVACLVLGGASNAGVVANGILQLGAVAILGWAMLPTSAERLAVPLGALGWLLAGFGLLALLQILPLPPALWGALPGRTRFLADYRALGVAPPWLPLSLAPDRALASLLALLPCLATFVLVLRATANGRTAALWMVIGVAALSIVIGALQLLGGNASRWYFYAITNSSNAVGLFANRNHLATLFLVTLPFVAALAARDVLSGRTHRVARRPLYIGVFAFITFGAALNGSSAGLALLVPCICACVFIFFRGIGKPLSAKIAVATAAIVAAGLLFAAIGPYHGRFLDKAISTKANTTRRTSMTLTATAARDFLPFGSGVGTFRYIYTGYEDPNLVNPEYVNHAHNDWVEVLLETGVLGLALLAGFCLWLLARMRVLWSGEDTLGSIARAATVSISLVLLHSLVDYPARTAAILCVSGLACGLIVAPKAASATRSSRRADEVEAPLSRALVAD